MYKSFHSPCQGEFRQVFPRLRTAQTARKAHADWFMTLPKHELKRCENMNVLSDEIGILEGCGRGRSPVASYAVFHEHAVRGQRYDAVATDVLYEVIANDHVQAWKPQCPVEPLYGHPLQPVLIHSQSFWEDLSHARDREPGLGQQMQTQRNWRGRPSPRCTAAISAPKVVDELAPRPGLPLAQLLGCLPDSGLEALILVGGRCFGRRRCSSRSRLTRPTRVHC
jgi:hypothetical protein